MFKDKDYHEVIRLTAPLAEDIVTVETPGNPRALPAQELAEAVYPVNPHVRAAKTVEEAVSEVLDEAKEEDDAVIIFGSLSYLGEAERAMKNRGEKLMDKEKIMEGVKLILEGIGEDPTREGLLETPDRIARMYEELAGGYTDSAADHLRKRFHVDSSDMVIEKDIHFYSFCEHHMLPFYGTAAIAYIPNGEVVGLSKIARTVEVFAKRLQLQERLTAQIADAFMEELKPQGVMVLIEAEHMCMTMRGIKKPGTKTVTVVTRGVFDENDQLQNKFFRMLEHH